MKAYVLDASVAAKWVLPAKDEPLSAEAGRFCARFATGDIGLSVPDLFWPEIGSILGKSVRAGRVSEASAKASIEWVGSLGLTTQPTKGLVGDAVAIARAFDCSVHDSLYIALSVASGRPMITADERLVNAVGAHLPVRWLGAEV